MLSFRKAYGFNCEIGLDFASCWCREKHIRGIKDEITGCHVHLGCVVSHLTYDDIAEAFGWTQTLVCEHLAVRCLHMSKLRGTSSLP